METDNKYHGKVVERARDKHRTTERIEREEYYSDDPALDVESEICRIEQLPKTSENIHRLENLKCIRTKRRWIGKWFENTCKQLQAVGEKKKQYILHTNPQFYWPWNPETVIVDTTFVDFYTDGSVKVKIFEGHPLLTDFAESWYSEVTGKTTLRKIENILQSDTVEKTKYEKLM